MQALNAFRTIASQNTGQTWESVSLRFQSPRRELKILCNVESCWQTSWCWERDETVWSVWLIFPVESSKLVKSYGNYANIFSNGHVSDFFCFSLINYSWGSITFVYVIIFNFFCHRKPVRMIYSKVKLNFLLRTIWYTVLKLYSSETPSHIYAIKNSL